MSELWPSQLPIHLQKHPVDKIYLKLEKIQMAYICSSSWSCRGLGSPLGLQDLTSCIRGSLIELAMHLYTKLGEQKEIYSNLESQFQWFATLWDDIRKLVSELYYRNLYQSLSNHQVQVEEIQEELLHQSNGQSRGVGSLGRILIYGPYFSSRHLLQNELDRRTSLNNVQGDEYILRILLLWPRGS